MSPTLTDRSILFTEPSQARTAIAAVQRAGETVGVVPTMGALHEGHLSLIDAAAAECDRVVATIFVNPTQFGPGEDFERYPRDLQADIAQLEQRGVWAVFAPSVDSMYAPEHETFVEVGEVAAPWEGAARPIHFRGVATIVLKLLLIAPADRAYFGHKDYQQTLVVRRMVDDLNVPTEIRVCPTLREPDGIAMSSRNAYLTPPQRQQALAIWRSLELAERLHAEGETDVEAIRTQMLALIREQGGVEVEYLAILAAGTVCELTTLDQPAVVAIAARVGSTRLIDNHRIG